MLTDVGTATVRKRHPRVFRQESHWCIIRCNPSAKNFCCPNYCTAASCTSPSHANVRLLRAFFDGAKRWKPHESKLWLYAGCLITSRCMELSWSWNLWGVWWRAWSASGWRCQWLYLDGCSWFWYVGFEAFDSHCIDCVVVLLEVQKQRFLDVPLVLFGSIYHLVRDI